MLLWFYSCIFRVSHPVVNFLLQVNGVDTDVWSANSYDNKLKSGSAWKVAEVDLGSILGATDGFQLTFSVRPDRSELFNSIILP